MMYLNQMLNNDEFETLRKINEKKPLSKKVGNDLGFSLGKLNYCLKALKEKGLINLIILKIIIN